VDLGNVDMFGTKKLVSLMDKSTSVGRGGGNSVSLFATAVLVMVIATFVICGVVFYGIQNARQGHSLERQIQASAAGVAQNITTQIRIYQKILQGLSRDRQLIGLFEANNRSELSGKEQEFLRLLPDAKFVRLLPAEWDDQETGVGPKLSFAALAMLRSVKQTRRVSPAEVHQFNSKQQHIAIAVPVLKGNNGPVVGVVHLSLSMDLIK
jgi:hypothetical protein